MENFGGRTVSCGLWPSRSPDLCVIFLTVGKIEAKRKVRDNPRAPEALEEEIRSVKHDVSKGE